MSRPGKGQGMIFDKVPERKGAGYRGVLLVTAMALLGAWLAVWGALHWREADRAAERARVLHQVDEALLSQTTGCAMLGGRLVARPQRATAQGNSAGPFAAG